MKEKTEYHSIIISDVHLGTRDSKAEQLIAAFGMFNSITGTT